MPIILNSEEFYHTMPLKATFLSKPLHFQNEQFNQIGGILRQVEHVNFN